VSTENGRQLILVRHAKSSWDDPALSDFDRPLNTRGLRDAPRMARLAFELGATGFALAASPAARAWSTAKFFAAALGQQEADISAHPAIYEASGWRLRQWVAELPAESRRIMLFGHNPGLSELAHNLSPHCPFADMPTCAMTWFAWDSGDWRAAASGGASIHGYYRPKALDDTGQRL